MIRNLLEAQPSRGLGLSRKERAEYSLSKLVRCAIENKPIDGVEREYHDELAKRSHEIPRGILAPIEIFSGSRRRDLNATVFGQGGATIPTNVDPDVIPLLRNMSACERMGVRTISGLHGSVAIPRHVAASTANVVGEQTAAPTSTPALDQILLSPHRVTSVGQYSKQLVLQSSVDVDGFLREDLMKVVALKWDSLILNGQGGGEPTGILNTIGIGSLIFGGTATWQQILNFEGNLSAANALGVPGASIGWITSPSVKTRWKGVAKTGVGVTSVVPMFLWPELPVSQDGDGIVNGYRAAATNQILNNLVFFGNWADAFLGIWGDAFDIVIDPYKLAEQATIRIIVNTFGDVAIRRAQSFCVSGDAGNQ